MGAKVSFNHLTRTIKVTQAPTLINGELVVELDVKADLYGDQKEDWLANPTTLRKLRPPITVIGGQPTPTGSAGNTFFQAEDWKLEPYDANHIFRITGNLYSTDGKSPFIAPTGGSYLVQIERVVSNIVDTVVTETGVSGLTAEEVAIITDLRNMQRDVWQFRGCDPANPAALTGDGQTETVITVAGKTLTVTPTDMTRT